MCLFTEFISSVLAEALNYIFQQEHYFLSREAPCCHSRGCSAATANNGCRLMDLHGARSPQVPQKVLGRGQSPEHCSEGTLGRCRKRSCQLGQQQCLPACTLPHLLLLCTIRCVCVYVHTYIYTYTHTHKYICTHHAAG